MRLFLFSCSIATALAIAACSNGQQATSSKDLEFKPAEFQQSELQQQNLSVETKQAEVKPNEVKPIQVKPIQVKPIKVKPLKFKQIQFRSVELKPIKLKEITFKGVEVRENRDLTAIILPADVLFDFDKDNIRPDAEVALRQVETVLTQRYANNSVRIDGHTDAIADNSYNQNLSERRANSVKRWLMQQSGIESARMTTRGYGETVPVAANTKADGSDNPEGRQKNRRVEIVIQK
ncbi:MAG: Peptidoglycan-associated lipoprotein [Chroococcidiopsis cubana SAG 39.79]|uniref:OmpA-like domain-containing protein n=1 Tax=Chroococcidiopsis cubana SAG 39.79 TaxID=388085 RepID=A0AB37UD79_9CYAN|nr:OmpA family protein [Chroococcidiopsis cubana]MDZ4871768.1 Peptidoglycan-associated lipoprotein [Chroococcidiopsis cubana SAG 39.79]PSB60245.1 OmpA family protein [Chroococcidiopsis cubana CCALA 043]RUT05805.1 hypothetical protein DSM107010_54400 [Chroococcidiopsis cubana SAG 39.79]